MLCHQRNGTCLLPEKSPKMVDQLWLSSKRYKSTNQGHPPSSQHSKPSLPGGCFFQHLGKFKRHGEVGPQRSKCQVGIISCSGFCPLRSGIIVPIVWFHRPGSREGNGALRFKGPQMSGQNFQTGRVPVEPWATEPDSPAQPWGPGTVKTRRAA